MNVLPVRVENAGERVVTLQGGCNFRDIGGYRTTDGSTVRWGQVYRAGVLSYFTDDDHAPLTTLGVRTICDLRRAEEREREPTRWPAAVNVMNWDDGVDAPKIRRFYARHSQDEQGMRQAMLDLYLALPQWIAPRLRGMFDSLATGQTPLVVHCAAGKDRTGVAVAVLLESLGVDRQTVVEDYLLTNHTTDYEQFVRAQKVARLGLSDEAHPLMNLPPDVRRVLFSADEEYLAAGLHQIDSKFGGTLEYLRSTVGVSDASLQSIRERLTEHR
jgi:protein-tyrosine phosphatase